MNISDPKGNQHSVKIESFLNGSASALSRGDCVSMDGNGDILASATANLHTRVGIVYSDIAAGEAGLVQTGGYCDYVTTDGSVLATDLVLVAADGGVAQGAAATDIASNPTLAFHVLGANLAVDDVNTGYVLLNPGGAAG